MSYQTHNQCKTNLYRRWHSMKQRCLNKRNTAYKNYGGRGIKVCEEWSKFEPFMKWAIENGFKETLSLDRINVNGNYEPENCRWVDKKTQDWNRRNSITVDIEGNRMNLKEASRVYEIPYKTMLQRYQKGERGAELIKPSEKGIVVSVGRFEKILRYRKALSYDLLNK